MQTKLVECYNFPEFCKLAQEAILEGYEFDFDSNERYPTSFGGYYNVVMVKDKVQTKDEPEVVFSETVVEPKKKKKSQD